ncbi:histidine kinase dimerization/phosphoacceptor domain -containing protein [Methylocella sp.]|uniref:histidine kinase dimerization/phosphoacceptor domain -containing protein n=1 Tax=Methylocella sp. TaxID=1978226 RepID=UPI003784A97B
MTAQTPDLTACDREPIHVPGAIQPHGALLAARRADLRLAFLAGDPQALFGLDDWRGRPLADFIGAEAAGRAAGAPQGPASLFLGRVETTRGALFEGGAHASDDFVFVELEPVEAASRSASEALCELEVASVELQRAESVQELCDLAARQFRSLTGFDRVMIYRFLEDESGKVVAEARRAGVASFLNQHFPASDIPRQARALYVRNLVRTIPEVDYAPEPLRPEAESAGVDLSDCVLRSVSPIHLEYLRNMGVTASASVSIVIDGRLWGLVACHHESARRLDSEARGLCRALAFAFAQHVRAKAEAEDYRERLRLASFSSSLVEVLARDGPLDQALANHLDETACMLRADGVAIVHGHDLIVGGAAPGRDEIAALARWIALRGKPVFATDRLPQIHPPAKAFQRLACGVVASVLSFDEPWAILWLRAEKIETVNWAGNPHKPVAGGEVGALTPRASFALWSETVRGRARGWTPAEVEAAGRLGALVIEARQTRRERDLNRRLTETLKDKDLLIEQKQYLIGEVNHRVQNSLQLVTSFLTLQAMSSREPGLREAVEEANRRIAAVALLHRRLYRGDQIEMVQLARYIEDLVADAMAALGVGWKERLTLDLAPAAAPTDQAASIGLILTELLINANKYAYGGAPGPLAVALAETRGQIELTVSDKGRGRAQDARQGFGGRMLEALTRQLGGQLTYEDNRPGLRAKLTAPLRAGV